MKTLRNRILGAVLAALLTAVIATAVVGCSTTTTTDGSTSSGSSVSQASNTTSSTAAPTGTPPSGAPPGGTAPGGSQSAQYTPTGAYTLRSGSATQTSKAYNATDNDESGVLLTGGTLRLDNPTVTTSGDSSSSDESSFYGLNAGILAKGGTLTVNSGTIKTTGDGANDLFAYGDSTTITVTDTKMTATGQYAHGIMASGGGTIVANNVTVTTAGGSSAPIATDRGGGTITVNGGSYTCTGNNSPAIYSTGTITTKGGTFAASGSEVVVIEGSNSVNLTDSKLTSSKSGKWGVMIYQSMSGDAEGAKGTYTQTGGSLTDTASDSPLFYITNSTGVITLKGVKVSAVSGTLVKAAAGNWGTSGSNGGTAILTADSQTLKGDIVADNISTAKITLKNSSSLTGAINQANTAKSASLTLDKTSSWTVTKDSHLTTITGAVISGSTITNIRGNGHTVTYDASASANSALGGKTYTLSGGGSLKPA